MHRGQGKRQDRGQLHFHPVEVKPGDTDRYGRPVGLVYIEGGKCLNQEIIKAGFARVFERYCNQPQCMEWKQLEKTAREAKLGLWAGPNPVPPGNSDTRAAT